MLYEYKARRVLSVAGHATGHQLGLAFAMVLSPSGRSAENRRGPGRTSQVAFGAIAAAAEGPHRRFSRRAGALTRPQSRPRLWP